MHILSVARTIDQWFRSTPSAFAPVIVLGAPRSGTSLLKNLLMSHSQLTGANRESTGVLRWRDLAGFRIEGVDANTLDRILAEADGLPDYYRRVCEAVAEANGAQASRFVDKITITTWRLRYLRRFLPGARYVNIVRDGRDAYCSALHHPNVKQSSSAAAFAKYWKSCVSMPAGMIPASSMITIRYEDLAADAAATLGKVMDWLGLQFEPEQIDPQRYASVSALKHREVHRNLAKPISTASVGRWQLDLDARSVADFARIAGAELASLGYPIDLQPRRADIR